MVSFVLYYYVLKTMFLYSLVRSFVRYEPLQKHFLFLSILFTAAVAFLSYALLYSSWEVMPWRAWEIWLGKLFLLTLLYFWLLSKFDEGPFFWLLLLAGLGLVWF